jgi:uncharacterized membrane protein HdeD (DUF308 family)
MGWSALSGLVSICLGVYLLIGLDLIVDGTALVAFASAIHASPAVRTDAA